MIISIFGTNGMLSMALTKYFFKRPNTVVDVYGLSAPVDYQYSNFFSVDLLKNEIDYEYLVKSDVVIYASGAGVQAALNTDSMLMYALNVNIPIELTLQLKKWGYTGKYISFGSYMEIGSNNEEGKCFSEDEVVCSSLPVTNDYALSKRLYGRYMKDFIADYTYWHFILPNMFSVDDFKPGNRLIPYVLKYLQDYTMGKATETPSFSAGTQTRQYITLEEVMEVLNKALEKDILSGLYCIGGGEFLSIRNLIERMFQFYKVSCDNDFFGKEIRRDGDIKSLCLNGEKLKKAVGYLPEAKIEDLLLKYA
ncbi:NAD(P)-dependent oxidoreductase [Bacteroides sp. 214]|uniref:NAD-dependent epimerase/dehydratase family protein n=1 Tax=Bacteroides sp. 214 TaxID=2302935 RepID=UPI0013D073DE|nr:NAD(P)-dependent oxidoreductase [Bacteroides sp. 214]NDW11786.1 NAD(P)-dependent oxidoreductase [Bacteroides sp. 214]